MDSDQNLPPVQSEKLALLQKMIQEEVVKQEILRCLSDGLWHTTSELARFARQANPVIGLVTVGTILTRMQDQLGEYFLEQMVQKVEEGVSSWRIGMEWLDVVNEVLKQKHKPTKSSIFDE